MRALAFALRQVRREARAGELGVLAAAVWIAVTALTAVGFFTSRVAAGITEQAGEVLAGDLRLESGRPLALDHAYAAEARRRGLEVALTLTFPSVVHGADAQSLALVDGASAGYPLRGRLRIAPAPFAPGVATSRLPAPGEAWADARLLARLGLARGGHVRAGALELTVTEVLDYRPDQGSVFATVAPTLLLAAEDLPRTQLLVPGSRAAWALVFAGPRPAIDRYAAWLRGHKSAAERLIDVGESSAELRSAMDRSGRFLNLASLATLLLAAVAVAMGARRYVARRLDAAALYKCLGARQRDVLAVHAIELAVVGLAGGLAGVATGFLAQGGLALLARDLVSGPLPPPSVAPVFLGLATALLILVGFAAPPLLELGRVPPARALRRTLAPRPLALAWPVALALGVLFVLLWALLRDAALVGGAALGLAAAAALLAAAGTLLVRAGARLRGAARGATRFGIANVARRGRESVVQVVAFGLALTVLLVLALVRNDLVEEWRSTLPPGAPDHFLVNIPPEDVPRLGAFLTAQGIRTPTFAPWVRARLLSVNGAPVARLRPVSERGRGFIEREQNLSWSAALPEDNRVIAGRFWGAAPPASPEVSVASEFQEALGLRVGDRLGFDVAGETVTATVSSVRKVRWDGFRPNFFLLFSPGVLEAAAGTYMTSVHVPPAARPALATLARDFPSVSVVDVGTLIDEVRGLMDRAALAVEYVFLFTLGTGLVVLLAAVQATRDERRYESALLRVLGASRGVVLRGVATEFAVIGALAGLLAAVIATAAGALVATRLFGLPWRPDGRVFAWGIAAGTLLVGLAGTVATRSVVTTPPAATLRRG